MEPDFSPRPSLSQLKYTTYSDVGQFSRHVLLIASEVPAKQKIFREPKPLTATAQAVLEILPQHRLSLQVNSVSLAEALRERPELANLSTAKRIARIKSAVKTLHKQKLIQTSKQRLPRLREATQGEIETHLRLVDEVLRHQRPFPQLAKHWRQHFTLPEAHSIGTLGLIGGLELLDESKLAQGERSKWSYLTGKIASAIADAIEKKVKEQKRRAKFDDQKPVSAATTKAQKRSEISHAERTDAIRLLHAFHSQGVLRGHEAVVLALRVLKRKQAAIGKHFNLTNSRICQIESSAKRKIRKATSEESEED